MTGRRRLPGQSSGGAVNTESLEPRQRKVRFYSYWSERTWFAVGWTCALLAIVIAVEIQIASSPDDYGLNETFAVWMPLVGLGVWVVGMFVIWFVAWLVGWMQKFTSR